MKLSKNFWWELAWFIIFSITAIFSFIFGDIALGICDIILAIIQIGLIVYELSQCWNKSETIKKKFTFTCPKCGNQLIPTFIHWLCVPHIGSKRYFKCYNCNKRVWMKRK